MYYFLETLLGETIGNWYILIKEILLNRLLETKALRNNPYNFTIFIREIWIGLDPTRGNTSIQDVGLADD